MRNLWSFAGEDDRRDVSQLLIEPFVNCNLGNGWYLLTDSVITVDWEIKSGDKVTLPLGGGFGRIFQVGKQPMNARAEACYNAIHPDGAPNGTVGGTMRWLFPKKRCGSVCDDVGINVRQYRVPAWV